MTNRLVKRIVFYIQIEFTSPVSILQEEYERTITNLLENTKENLYVAGSSLAGAMHAYLDKVKNEDSDRKMSSVFVSDLYFENIDTTNIRECVALSDNKTAVAGSNYEIEIIESGAKGQFFVELTIREQDNENAMIADMADVLYGFHSEEIRIGRKKTRGYGKCRVLYVASKIYDRENYMEYCNAYNKERFCNLGNEQSLWIAKARQRNKMIHIEVPLRMKGCISIRQYAAKKNQPDFLHLTDAGHPVIPGSSFAGALRHKVKAILEELECCSVKLPYSISDMVDIAFGSAEADNGGISKILIDEAVIRGARPLTLMRTGISRFEASAREKSLYKEKVFADGIFELHISVSKDVQSQWILGILLLALKDLQNGFLAVGGQTAVGRGIFENNGAICIDGKSGIENQIIKETLNNMKMIGRDNYGSDKGTTTRGNVCGLS